MMTAITFNELPQAINLLANDVSELKQLIKQQGENIPNPDTLLTIQQASTLLNLSVPTLYGYTQRQEIPHAKRGGRLYFSRLELIAWVKEGRVRTYDELRNEAEKLGSKVTHKK